MAYCTSCLPENGYITAWYPNYPPEIINYYEDNQIKYLKPPPHNPQCSRIFSNNELEITSPVNNVEYSWDKNDTTQMLLTCNAAIDVDKVIGILMINLYCSAKSTDKVFFKPPEGRIKISCTDDKGRNTDIISM